MENEEQIVAEVNSVTEENEEVGMHKNTGKTNKLQRQLKRELHLKNFVDRLNLESFLAAQFGRRIPFVLAVVLLTLLMIIEYPAATLFQINTSIDSILQLTSLGDVKSRAGIYDYLEVITYTHVPKITNFSRLHSYLVFPPSTHLIRAM